MHRSLTIALGTALAAPVLVAATATPARAENCTQLWRSANATQYTCSNPSPNFQFRTWVQCKRPGLPNFSYFEYGPYRRSGGTSAAYCDRQANDYRFDDGTQGVA